MYKYYIYLKIHGIVKNVIVSAERHRAGDKELTLYEGKEIVAEFRMSEILGWVRVLKDNK